MASCSLQSRSFSVGFSYLELFRATLNYVYFLRRGYRARRSTLRDPSDLQTTPLALLLGHCEIRNFCFQFIAPDVFK